MISAIDDHPFAETAKDRKQVAVIQIHQYEARRLHDDIPDDFF